MRPGNSLCVGIVCLFGATIGQSLSAQSVSEVLAYEALLRTPVAGLVPLATTTILNDAQPRAAFAARYSYVPDGPNNPQISNLGATGIVPIALGTSVSFTAGITTAARQSTAFMGSIGADTRVGSTPLSDSRDAQRLVFALNGEIAYAKPQHESMVTGSVGMPISLVPGNRRAEGIHFVPYVTPALGIASVHFDDRTNVSESNSRFMLGGGLAIYNRTSNVAVNIGFQYISIENTQTQVGIALVLGGR